MKQKHQLAELQLAIMQVLWDREEASVAEVREALKPSRELAHTTVATMLTKMERKGQVQHRIESRQNVYRAIVSQDNVEKSMLSDLYERLFQRDLSSLVCRLLDDSSVNQTELNELKRLIRQKERELKQTDTRSQ